MPDRALPGTTGGDRVTPDEIRAARWFRAKGRPIAEVREHDRAPVGEDAALEVLEVAYADAGHPDRYLVPRVGEREPVDGEGAWRAIADAVAADAVLTGRRGRFEAGRTAAADELLGSAADRAALAERRLHVEQSNTSVVLGSRLILKLYRLLEAGENPDLEMSAFLTDAGFADTPPVAGAVTYVDGAGTRYAAAMLQAFVPSTGDAWATMLRALERDEGEATGLARQVGDLTRRLHAALASSSDDPAFPARLAASAESAAWRASAERQLAQAVTAVSGGPHDRLVQLAPHITARFADVFGAATGRATVTRIHGDYHLGQLLARTDGGFSVIDFEGEPARPLGERRQPASALRDVAGMLRSLDYAATTARADDRWLPRARAVFLDAYGGVPADQQDLLDAFELEKACYEVRYEANNRPSWLWLPLDAVNRLAAA